MAAGQNGYNPGQERDGRCCKPIGSAEGVIWQPALLVWVGRTSHGYYREPTGVGAPMGCTDLSYRERALMAMSGDVVTSGPTIDSTSRWPSSHCRRRKERYRYHPLQSQLAVSIGRGVDKEHYGRWCRLVLKSPVAGSVSQVQCGEFRRTAGQEQSKLSHFSLEKGPSLVSSGFQ